MKSKKRLAKSLCLTAGLLFAAQAAEAAYVPPPGPVASRVGVAFSQTNMAARELGMTIGRMQQTRGVIIPFDKPVIPCAGVVIEGNSSLGEKRVRELLPELAKENINVRRLSMQLQLLNSCSAFELAVRLQPEREGKFKLHIILNDKKSEYYAESLNNTGNRFTGKWRLLNSYINNNLSGHADTLGVTYITSPSHWDDFRQMGISYRRLLPKANSEVKLLATLTDVDSGNFVNEGPVQIQADGSSRTIGANYIYYLSNSAKAKDSWEFGFEHKDYTNKCNYSFMGNPGSFEKKYALDLLTLRFRHQEGRPNSFFRWNVEVEQSVNGDAEDYHRMLDNTSRQFTIWRAGAFYQYRTKKDWLLSGRLTAQYSDDNVMPPEQLGIGGVFSLRGYNERALTGDCGIAGNLEIYTPELLPHLRALVFTDFAALHNNNETIRWRSEGASTAGLGLRYADKANGLNISLDYVAKMMDDINGDALALKDMKRWNLVLTKMF